MDCIVYCFYDNYILLVLKYRYFTNITYGYIKKSSYIKELIKEKQEQLERLMGGECFKGRKALLGELRVVLSDFR